MNRSNEVCNARGESPAGEEIFDEDGMRAGEGRGSELAGVWSQVRLFREANLEDASQVARWCARVGLIKDVECRVHRKPMILSYNEGHGFRYRCHRCKKAVGALEGSVFEGLKLPLAKALMLILCWSQNLTYEQAMNACIWSAEDSKPSSTTVASWWRRIREALVDRVDELSGDQIGGHSCSVQVDECQIGRRKYNRGRLSELRDTWVIGMIDEDTGDVRMEIVRDRTADTLQAVIHKHVKRLTTIKTDMWRAYLGLEHLEYYHDTVNHSESFVDPETGTHTQRIESHWRRLRRRFSKGGIRHEDIGLHLVEDTWRRWCENRNLDPFGEIIRTLALSK